MNQVIIPNTGAPYGEPILNPSHDWHTLKEAAEYLRVDTRTVRRMVQSGRLKACQIGRAYRFSREALEAALVPVETAADKIAKSMASFIGNKLTPDDHQ